VMTTPLLHPSILLPPSPSSKSSSRSSSSPRLSA